MNYSNFIMAVFAIYIVYYAGNILYDTFIKKGKKREEDDEEVVVLDEEIESPQEVSVNDDEDKAINENDEQASDEEEKEYISNVTMEIESQGIPLEQLDIKYYDVSTRSNLMKIILNNIYTFDKYFFIDVSLLNKSNIRYDIDQIRFKIEDKKQTKATNFQSIEILPLMQVNTNKVFKKSYRNVFVFEKFTFPDEKVFTIEISEKQISGRSIILRIDYADVLHADTFIE